MAANRLLQRRHLLRILAACALACLVVGAADTKPPFRDYRDGDIVLQHIRQPFCEVISAVTQSPYSHCGLVVHRSGKPYVLEAVGPVQYTPLDKWLAFGDQGRVTVIRVKDLDAKQIQQAIRVAKTFLGKPYDIQYEPDDAKIYCSELVYKAFLRGCKVKLGTIQRLGDLNWRPYETLIRKIAGGKLPLDRRMITPVALVRSPRTAIVHSTFPKAEQ
jgi:hypothetical protein